MGVSRLAKKSICQWIEGSSVCKDGKSLILPFPYTCICEGWSDLYSKVIETLHQEQTETHITGSEIFPDYVRCFPAFFPRCNFLKEVQSLTHSEQLVTHAYFCSESGNDKSSLFFHDRYADTMKELFQEYISFITNCLCHIIIKKNR